jgi:hypothetical protein
MLWTADNLDVSLNEVFVFRRSTQEKIKYVIKIDSDKRQITRLAPKEGVSEAVPPSFINIDDYEEVVEDISLFHIVGIPLPKEFQL